MAQIFSFPSENDSAINLLTETIERLRTGEATAIALVEARANGDICIAHTQGTDIYCQIMAGVARLFQKLASE
jgi:hypothetical protein